MLNTHFKSHVLKSILIVFIVTEAFNHSRGMQQSIFCCRSLPISATCIMGFYKHPGKIYDYVIVYVVAVKERI